MEILTYKGKLILLYRSEYKQVFVFQKRVLPPAANSHVTKHPSLINTGNVTFVACFFAQIVCGDIFSNPAGVMAGRKFYVVFSL